MNVINAMLPRKTGFQSRLIITSRSHKKNTTVKKKKKPRTKLEYKGSRIIITQFLQENSLLRMFRNAYKANGCPKVLSIPDGQNGVNANASEAPTRIIGVS